MSGIMMRGEAPKIVQIETRYVETDAVNFRDVVQSLTGMNSSTDWIGRNYTYTNAAAAAAAAATSSSTVAAGGGGIAVAKPADQEQAGAANDLLLPPSSNNSMPPMNNNMMSFKDFNERLLLLELPPIQIEEMPWL